MKKLTFASLFLLTMQIYGGFSPNHNYYMIFFSFPCDNLPYLRQTIKSPLISVAKG